MSQALTSQPSKRQKLSEDQEADCEEQNQLPSRTEEPEEELEETCPIENEGI